MTIPLEDVRLEERSEVTGPWQTVVWNDPVNLMSYVVHVFRTYFGYTREHAERLMLLVHHEG
ncbi:ATP-dependent Clp protease adaptor ClpS, partial [Microbacterium sp. 69-7]